MYKIVGLIIREGVYVEHSINCTSDPFIKASKAGFIHGWIMKGTKHKVIAIINSDGSIQEV